MNFNRRQNGLHWRTTAMHYACISVENFWKNTEETKWLIASLEWGQERKSNSHAIWRFSPVCIIVNIIINTFIICMYSQVILFFNDHVLSQFCKCSYLSLFISHSYFSIMFFPSSLVKECSMPPHWFFFSLSLGFRVTHHHYWHQLVNDKDFLLCLGLPFSLRVSLQILLITQAGSRILPIFSQSFWSQFF